MNLIKEEIKNEDVYIKNYFNNNHIDIFIYIFFYIYLYEYINIMTNINIFN